MLLKCIVSFLFDIFSYVLYGMKNRRDRFLMRTIEINLEIYFDCCIRCILVDYFFCNCILIRLEILVLDFEGCFWEVIVIKMNFI